MTEIPLEIMMHAERLYDEGGYKTVPQIIAEAIMAERERCIEILEGFDSYAYVHEAIFLIGGHK